MTKELYDISCEENGYWLVTRSTSLRFSSLGAALQHIAQQDDSHKIEPAELEAENLERYRRVVHVDRAGRIRFHKSISQNLGKSDVSKIIAIALVYCFAAHCLRRNVTTTEIDQQCIALIGKSKQSTITSVLRRQPDLFIVSKPNFGRAYAVSLQKDGAREAEELLERLLPATKGSEDQVDSSSRERYLARA